MTDNRGRHKKGVGNATGKKPMFKGTVGLTPEGERLRLAWEKLTDKEKSCWGYNFEGYREAHKKTGEAK